MSNCFCLQRSLQTVLVFLMLVGLGSTGCSDSTEPSAEPVERAVLGVGANPRGAPGNDPLLTDAYIDVLQGGFPIAHVRLDWGAVETHLANFTWTEFDDHVRQAIAHGVELSVEVSVVDRHTLGLLPADLRGQDLSSPNLRIRFARFAQGLFARGNGTVRFLWVGGEVNRYLDLLPDAESHRIAFRTLIAATQDSLLESGASLDVGTSFSAFDLARNMEYERYTGIAETCDYVGWTVFGRGPDLIQSLTPAETVSLAESVLETFGGVSHVVTEIGFSADSPDDRGQAEFATLLTGWLGNPPASLYGAFAVQISDLHSTFASARAAALYPSDEVLRSRLESHLRAQGLKESNGLPTDAWRRIQSWNLEGS